MAQHFSTRMGRRGSVVLPATLRRRFRLKEGSPLVAEEREGGIFLRPAITIPIDVYSADRLAEFLLKNAADLIAYEAARAEVRNLGIDPDTVPHEKPGA